MTVPSRLSVLAPVALAVLALLVPSAAQAKHAPKARSFSGTVTSVARDHRSFRIRRTGHAGVLFRVGHGLKRGKGARLTKGQALDVRARRVKGHWVASRIARSPSSADDENTAGDDDTADDPGDDVGDDDTGDDDSGDDPGDLLDPGDDPGDLLDPDGP
jgi:hypothetical protein